MMPSPHIAHGNRRQDLIPSVDRARARANTHTMRLHVDIVRVAPVAWITGRQRHPPDVSRLAST